MSKSRNTGIDAKRYDLLMPTQYDVGVDLRELLRNGSGDEVICEAVKKAIMRKPVGHQFTEGVQEHEEVKIMAQIGG